MDSDANNAQRAALRESYNRSAKRRDGHVIEDWKARERDGFAALLLAEGKQKLLEIGSGPGRDSQFFREQGLEPTCIDLSPAMVELCREKGLKAYVMDMIELSFPDASFDAVYAMNSLLHLPKAEFPLALKQIERVLKPGGLAFIGVYGGYDHEGIWDEDKQEPKRFFSFFTDERIQQEVARVFEIVSFHPVFFEPEDAIHWQGLVGRKKIEPQSREGHEGRTFFNRIR